jgi:hypothetical protein
MCAQQQKHSSFEVGLELFCGASSQNACDQKSTTRRSYAAELSISSAATIMILRQGFIDIGFEFITGPAAITDRGGTAVTAISL